jgi:hypothetical protein
MKFKQTLCSLIFVFVVSVLINPVNLMADDIDIANLGTGGDAQTQFNNVVRDLGVGLSYVANEPSEARGILGFDVGVEISSPEIKDGTQYMQNAFQNSDAPGRLVLPKVRADKGLPLGFDVSGYIAGQPSGNARLFGAALKYAFLEGGVTTPAVAVRGHGTRLSGVDTLDLMTYGADVSVSKGFDVPLLLGITPFAGYSSVQISGQEEVPSLDLNDYDTSEGRVFVGSRLSFGFFNLVAQADLAEVNIYSVRANFGF